MNELLYNLIPYFLYCSVDYRCYTFRVIILLRVWICHYLRTPISQKYLFMKHTKCICITVVRVYKYINFNLEKNVIVHIFFKSYLIVE